MFINVWSSAHLDEEALFFFPNKLFLLCYLFIYSFIHFSVNPLLISRLIACKLSLMFPVSSSVMDLWLCLNWLSCSPFLSPFTTLIGASVNKRTHSWRAVFTELMTLGLYLSHNIYQMLPCSKVLLPNTEAVYSQRKQTSFYLSLHQPPLCSAWHKGGTQSLFTELNLK